jgi:hypothetical protein
METRTYTKNELKEFIRSGFFNNLDKIPISKLRALSQVNNPRASENDILLVVQYDENRLAGYLGVLPDYLFGNGQKEKIGWLTCFWIDEKYKSMNVAASLFLRVIRAWEQKIFITNIVPWLEPVYQKTKIFQPSVYKSGFRGYMRFNLSEILPPKKPVFQKITSFLKIIDCVFNWLHDIRLSSFKKYNLEEVNYGYLSRLDDECAAFIDLYNQKYWNRRGKDEINWILAYPWLIQGAKDYDSKRYYFSSVSKRFFYQLIKFTGNDKKIKGLMLICVREHNITVPYVFSDGTGINDMSRLLINTMLELKISMITVYNDELTRSLKKIKTPFYFNKEVKKPFLISKKFDFVNNLNFQDGDGDCAFY